MAGQEQTELFCRLGRAVIRPKPKLSRHLWNE